VAPDKVAQREGEHQVGHQPDRRGPIHCLSLRFEQSFEKFGQNWLCRFEKTNSSSIVITRC
jgi:hypothetical protein